MKDFENLTVSELRKLNEEFKEQNSDVQTAEELLEELNEEE